MKNLYIIFGAIALLSGLGVITFNEEFFNPNKEASALLSKGKLLFDQGTEETMKKSVEIFTTVASQFPDTKQAKESLYYLAEGYEKLGNIDVAIGRYRNLLSFDLEEKLADRVRFKIARLQLSRYNTEEGFNGLMVLLSRSVDDLLRSDIYTEIARFHLRQKDYEQSRKNYDIALTENSKNQDANLELASAMFKQGQYTEALIQYKKYFNIFIDRDLANQQITARFIKEIYNSAVSMFHEGETEVSKMYFSFLTDKFPGSLTSENCLYYLGNIQLTSGNYEKAVEYFTRVIKEIPDEKDENAYIKLGQAYYHLKDYQKSLRAFIQVRELFPAGKYLSIAKRWENEAKNLMQEKLEMESKDSTLPVEEPTPAWDYLLPGENMNEPALDDGAIVP